MSRVVGRMLMGAVLVIAGLAVTATPASANVVQDPGPPCRAGDNPVTDDEFVISDSGAATARGWLCEALPSTGFYVVAKVTDTATDGRCAHASVMWFKQDNTHDDDYGMYVCGTGSSDTFYTPTRNWTRYWDIEFHAFYDNHEGCPGAAAGHWQMTRNHPGLPDIYTSILC